MLVDVVDRADVRVVERRGRLGLASEPLQGDLITEELLGQELERHAASQPRVLGLVDDTHPSAAELVDDPIVGDGLTDHCRGMVHPTRYVPS